MNFPFIFAKNRWPRAGRVIQVVEHMPSKYEALSSNPSKFKKKKKEEEWMAKNSFFKFCISRAPLVSILHDKKCSLGAF
jgi:hypothetical protein